MRIASVVLVAVILTTCAISGTFAKYTAEVDSSDRARVAKWGFTSTAISITDLFKTAYVDQEMTAAEDAIAPGTTNSASFSFSYGGEAGINAPEVAYEFTVDLTGSLVDSAIAANNNITWKLDDGTAGTYNELIESILKLACKSGVEPTAEEIAAKKITVKYGPQEIPEAFDSTNPVHTITWNWAFSTGTDADVTDTNMGNATELDDVAIVIKITATQIDTYSAA